MRHLLFIALHFLLVLPEAAAEDHQKFFGTWGTEKQCARDPIQPGGTVLAHPYEISKEWLRQGDLWCLLSWGPVEQRSTGHFTGAYARCGEDSVRQYFLGMALSGDQLTLRWNILTTNGPLKICSGS